MEDSITVYANEDLSTLERGNNNLETLDTPEDELTGAFEYLVGRQEFTEAYKSWNHDAMPLLRLHDHLSNVQIYLGKPSAERIHNAIQKNEQSVQLA